MSYIRHLGTLPMLHILSLFLIMEIKNKQAKMGACGGACRLRKNAFQAKHGYTSRGGGEQTK